MCARVAASSSPSPERKYSTEARGSHEQQRKTEGAKSEPAGLDSSSCSVQGGRNVQQKGQKMWIDSKHPFSSTQPQSPSSGSGGSQGLRRRRGAAPLRPHPSGLNVLDAKRARRRHSAPPMLAGSGRCPGTAASALGTRRGALSEPLRASLGSGGHPLAAQGWPRRCCPYPCPGTSRAVPRGRGWGPQEPPTAPRGGTELRW